MASRRAEPARLPLALGLSALAIVGCAQVKAAEPCPVAPTTPPPFAATPPAAPPTAALPPGVTLSLSLRPDPSPLPHVHVEVDLDLKDAPPGAGPTTWWLAAGAPAATTRASATDARGQVAVEVRAHGAGQGVDMVLGRAPEGAVHLAYDVAAGDDAPDDPYGLLVLEDRFRGAGERLVALPEVLEGHVLPIELKIDGQAIHTEKGASSLGVGAVRRATIRPRGLRYSTFLAGWLGGVAVFDSDVGHDEAAWLGYTSFDPRPVVAELAQVRTALAEMFHALGALPGAPETYLLQSRSRPVGSFSTTPRFESVLLQVGLGEPWSGGLRLSMAQQLARRWIGDAVRFTPVPGRERDLGWFDDGVARYVAMKLLAHAGLLEPPDWLGAVRGELSVVATSPYGSKGNQELADLEAKDPVARATLMARGALYALRASAVLEERTHGKRQLQNVLADLYRQAEDDKTSATHPLPMSAWIDALSKDDPDAAKAFDDIIVKGGPILLPPRALGPCFRASMGEYVAFDPGFDVDATSMDRDGKVKGVRPGGPAAKAGLADGDVVESMVAREDDATVPVKLVVVRAGQKVNISYVPKGARGQGQTWTRVRGVAEDTCGEPP